MTDDFIERRIITGMIVSTEYLQQIQNSYNPQLLSSSTATILAGWCWDFFNEYHKAPNRDIEGIFTQHLKNGLTKDKAEWIEGVLESLSEEYERDQFNVDYLTDQTKQYFQERHLKTFAEDIRNELDAGNPTGAEELALAYTSVSTESQSSIDPFAHAAPIRHAFEGKTQSIVTFPKVLGQFWNQQFIRGGFVALMSPEKRGKTFMLMEIALRSMKSGCNVVFFQAGDMTEAQQIRRLCIYLAQKSDDPRYTQGMYLPEVDCQFNQLDSCDSDKRECDFGIYKDEMQANAPEYPGTLDKLIKLYKEFPDYTPCRNCEKYERFGAVWLKWQDETEPLKWQQAYKAIKRWRKRNANRFKLSTYPNDTLTVSEIKSLLNVWERQERFVPDVIVVDYADILAPDTDFRNLEFRHQKNKIWQRLRGLSQERHCLVVTATQAAASSYDHDTLRLGDFSEDKRQYAHVTAMYGLNRTEEEKKIGIMRLNEMVIREGDYDSSRTIKVLQRLQIGRPVLGSFY